MQKINYLTIKTIKIIDNLNPNHLGIYFSLFFHFLILLFAIGLPDFFQPKQIMLPNIIPIEIINVSETTSLTKKQTNQIDEGKKKLPNEQKKFNSSNNTEIQKVDLEEKPKVSKENQKQEFMVKEKKINANNINEKKVEIKEKKIPITNQIESLKQNKIKPKLKPKLKPQSSKIVKNNSDSDMVLEKKSVDQELEELKKIDPISPNIQTKPEQDFSIATMLKDLRNEESNNIIEEEKKEDEKDLKNENEEINNKNIALSISEIDLVMQQLYSCWNFNSGSKVRSDMYVRIGAKFRKNGRVIQNSIHIKDTNIPKSSLLFKPITESAMRTFLMPECNPLKFPKDKYSIWKDLTFKMFLKARTR